MDRARLALAAFCIAVLAGAVIGLRQFLPVVFDVPVATISLLVGVLSLVAYLVNPGGALALGFAVGQRTDFSREYGRVALVSVGAAFAGVLVGYGLFAVAVGPQLYGAVGTVVVGAAQFALTASLTFGIAVVAGGAVAEFRSRPE